MKSITKLLALGSIVAVSAYLKRQRSRTPAQRDAADADDSDPMSEVLTHSGISDVDPQPLTQVSGEGIDLEADASAHDELPDLHDKMPGPPLRP